MKDYKGEIIEAIGKSGKPYKCLELELVSGYKKRIFLEDAELLLLQIEDKKVSDDSFTTFNPFNN